MIGGVTRLGGLPGLPGRVTLSAGVTICHVNVSRWGNPPSRGRDHVTFSSAPNLNYNIMTTRVYKPGELFRRLYLSNMEQNEESQECTESEGEEDLKECNASTDNRATLPCRPSESQPVKNKRKATENHLLTTAKKAKRYPKNKAWSMERVEILLRYFTSKRSVTLMELISRPTWPRCIRRYVGVELLI